MKTYKEFLAEAKLAEEQSYKEFFTAALKKFGVTEPDQLEGDKKKEFFDYVDANWEGENEVDEAAKCDDDEELTEEDDDKEEKSDDDDDDSEDKEEKSDDDDSEDDDEEKEDKE